ncbi:hypothetical protein C7B65_15030 [Phormidesmis priestleyi ULC007]|uniref:Uncharacterized protein n=1 Tax=Phormidesmis priestleyi ULC007 TaxID=1920490 RepID=A0A2T1DDR6_9CYAN|nr:DUF6516 family protein [Phormidesmis priestleyi]PSB18604.1 hypothetical protein C7B65_15030 [Phormidesmis priestleyi ULC007]PZO49843.1 MAG: hypothetical protein DCF14_13055 [Phormidesmis priestleyi]
MPLEAYFQQIETAISTCSQLTSFTLDGEKRDTYEGFIRAEIKFTDGSILRVREFVSVEISVDRDMYAYQYMDATNSLIFRYDNTPHHKKLNLPTYPNHKHDGSEENVTTSSAPTLLDVLQEITARVESFL